MMGAFSSDRWKRIDTLFEAALAQPPDQQDAFLRQACGTDTALYEEVRALLRDAAEADRLLGESVTDFAAPLLPELEADLARDQSSAPVQVGPYRVAGELGRGGMGTVYLAERADGAYHKQVALKLVRRGLDTEDILRRFRLERQLLARLDHPHIARLLDGGMAADGRPYMVMEYVEGERVDRFCDEHTLSIEARLRLFTEIGQAVQVAHQNLVVHRDLKPSNILVTEAGEPKLLDFGIAKVLAEDSNAEAITRTGMHVLTPEYAAPEQLQGDPVTTSADIYALGVILYELLTGRRPFDGTDREPRGTTAPERPSTVVTRPATRSGRAGTAATVSPEAVSRVRQTTAVQLQRRLRGDLDTIVLKALHPEPERRYASAEAFVEDIKRHLAGLPVQAQRDMWGYRARKFIQRHRVSVVAAGLALVALATGLGVALWQAEQARQERDRAAAAADFLKTVLSASDPYARRGDRLDTLRVRDLVDWSADQVRRDLADQPRLQADMAEVLGDVYVNLGLYDRADSLFQAALAVRRGVYGDRHEAIALSLRSLGNLAWKRGRLEEAEQQYRAALALWRQLGDTTALAFAQAVGNLGNVLENQGRYDEAERLLQRALALHRQALGDRHPDVADVLLNLGVIPMRQGAYEKAEAHFREALRIFEAELGPDHIDVADAMNNLALSLHYRGAYAEAEPLFREVLAVQQRWLGEDHPDLAIGFNNVGLVLKEQGKLDEAEPFYREALDLRRRTLDPTHPRLALSLNNLAVLLWDQGKLAEAQPMLEEALRIYRHQHGDDHPDVSMALLNLAGLLHAQGDVRRPEPLYREALAISERTTPAGSILTAYAQDGLGLVLTDRRRYAEAESLLVASHGIFQTQWGRDDPKTQEVGQHLVDLYEAWGKPAQADRYRRAPDDAEP